MVVAIAAILIVSLCKVGGIGEVIRMAIEGKRIQPLEYKPHNKNVQVTD